MESPRLAPRLLALGLAPALAALCLSALFQDEEAPADPLPAPNAAITAGELRHHVSFLASDELRGRETGTPDSVRAARYLGRALAQAGARPAGDDGTFLQAVPLVRIEHAQAPRLFLTDAAGEAIEAGHGTDFTVNQRGAPQSTAALTVRTVSKLEELPAKAAKGEALFLNGSSRERRTWLDERGMGEGGGWGMLLRAASKRPGRASNPRSGGLRPADAGAGDETGPLTITVRGPLGERLQAGEFVAVRFESFAVRQEVIDYNVIGRIDGVGTAAHPELAAETIVFSAHFDHLGVGEAAEGEEDDGVDRVFNGADDDASGTAAVLELAEAFAAGAPPARTLLFLLAAGEEKGLLGTNHYIAHPAVPLERTVLNLNFEMIGRPDALVGGAGKLWLTGFERTTLGPAFQEAGFDVVADQRPEQNFFQRSDNYAFAVRGIVGQTLSSYDLHKDYHHVTDEVDKLDFAHMEAATVAAYAAARLVAEGTLTPAWLPGGKPGSRGR